MTETFTRTRGRTSAVERAVAGRDQYDLVHRGQGGHHLFDPGIDVPRLAVDAHQPLDLVLVAHGLERIDRQVQPMGRGAAARP